MLTQRGLTNVRNNRVGSHVDVPLRCSSSGSCSGSLYVEQGGLDEEGRNDYATA